MNRGFAPAILLVAALWLSTAFSQAEGFGQLDEPFVPALDAVPGDLTGLARAADGKYFVWGQFHRVGEFRRINLARMNADGTVDESFDAGLSALSTITKITVQDDQRVLATGSLFLADGTVLPKVVRFMPDGTVDNSFQLPENIGLIRSLTLVPTSQKILLDGLLLPTNNVAAAVLIRLEANGGIDPSFNSVISQGSVLFVQPLSNGQILLTGGQSSPPGPLTRRVPGGERDSPTIEPPLSFQAQAFQLLSQLSAVDMLVTPPLDFPPIRRGPSLWRLNDDGSIDETFSDDAIPAASSYPVGPNDVIYHGEDTFGSEPVSRIKLQRFLSNGEKDESFNPQLDEGLVFHSMIPLSNGEILVQAGREVPPLGPETVLVRLSHEGIVKATYVISGQFYAWPQNWIEQSDSGSALFISRLLSFANFADKIVQLASNGTIDTSLGAPFQKYESTSPIPQKNGQIYLTHTQLDFDSGTKFTSLVRLQNGGKIDASFSPSMAATHVIRSPMVLHNGDIIVEASPLGFYESSLVRLTPAGHTVRELTNSWPESSFSGNWVAFPGGQVAVSYTPRIDSTEGGPYLRFFTDEFELSLEISPPADEVYFPQMEARLTRDGKLLTFGEGFTEDETGFITEFHIARFLPDGQLDTSFNIPADPLPLFSPHITDHTGRLYTYRPSSRGGARSAGPPSNALPSEPATPPLQRYLEDGHPDSSFKAALTPQSLVDAIYVQNDGRLLIGGIFYSEDGKKITSLMRLMPDGSLDTSFVPPAGDVVPISSIAVEADGNILIGGPFDQIGGQPRAGIARLKSVEHAQMKGITVTSTGVSLQLDGNSGRTWWIQASDDLIAWETIRTITTGTETETVELPAPGTGNKFYRAVLAP